MRHRLSVLSIAIVLVITGCDMFAEDMEQLPGEPVEFEMLSSVPVEFEEVSEQTWWGPRIEEQGAFGITEEDDFAELWQSVARYDERDDIPDINFDEQTVIAVHQGMQPSTAYRVEVDRVTSAGNTAYVSALDLRPLGGCAGGDAITYPMTVIVADVAVAEVEAIFRVGDSCS